MRELIAAFMSMFGALVTIVLVVVFIGAICGLGVWACDVVSEVMP